MKQRAPKRWCQRPTWLWLLVAAVGCTAIIDGSVATPKGDDVVAHGSRPSAGGAGTVPAEAGAGVELGGVAGASFEPGVAGAYEAGVAGAWDVGSAGNAGEVESGGNGGDGSNANPPGSSGGEPSTSSEGGASVDETRGGATSGGGEASAGAAASSGSAGMSSGGGGITWTGPLPPGDASKGHLLVIADRCAGCHADNFGGRGFYRNISPDVETGIGAWTDRQIANAIRGGGGPGTQFCSVMPLYSGLKDQQVADMVAYLRGIPPVSNKITAVCPGHYP